MERKILIGILAVMVLIIGIGIVMAHENFTETKQLIDSGISCDNLSEEQLNEIGDYYMEQMHPGEAHEMMHEMMGGEDSETTKLMHIQMAKSGYCGESSGMISMMNMMGGNMMQGGMMSGGMMQGGSGMMSSEMMGSYYYQTPQNNSIYQNNFLGLQIFFYIILTLFVIVLILAIILLINKLKSNAKQKGGNNKK